jgi:hypothetical protein
VPRIVWGFVAGLALTAGPAFAQNPATPADAGKPKAGTVDAVLHALKQPAGFDSKNINDVPLVEILEKLSKQHGIAFVILEEQFRAEGVPDVKEKKPNLAATELKNMTLHQFLTTVLNSVDVTYMVKAGRIEVITWNLAYDVGRGRPRFAEEEGVRPASPLISMNIKGKPLKAVVEELADEYELSVVISPKVGDAMDTPVNARLLNVPSDQLLDRIVVGSELRVVRRGNTFLITTPEQAKELLAERVERARQLGELQRLRAGFPPLFFPPNLPGIGP